MVGAWSQKGFTILDKWTHKNMRYCKHTWNIRVCNFIEFAQWGLYKNGWLLGLYPKQLAFNSTVTSLGRKLYVRNLMEIQIL